MNTKNTDMKKISKWLISLLMASVALVGCDDMLTVDSKLLTTNDQYTLNAPGDSVYSTIGVLSRLQKLVDGYVLLGELRGDLMDISATSDNSLREINNFNVTSGNTYVNIKNYYDVINNCNYIIHNLDTSVIERGLQMKLREYAAIKAVRAWTYMQLALNYKTAKFYDKPILTVANAEKTYTESTFAELADILITDLEPIKDVPSPNIEPGNPYAKKLYFPIHFILGDLYLWRASLTGNATDYEKAATEYHSLMYNNSLIISGEVDSKTKLPTATNTVSYWVPVNNTISSSANLYWMRSLAYSSPEAITVITCPTVYGQKFYLDSLNNQHKIIPSAVAISNWDNQTYYLNKASNSQGDLRKYGSISYSAATVSKAVTDYTFSGVTDNSATIYKYKAYNQNVVVYRSPLLYLRYAEAVNRLQKPKLAFAVLKYGLNSTTMANEKIVPAKEKGTPVPVYLNFDSRFSNNIGIRMRGLGNMDKDTTFFILPKMANMNDSVLYVEDMIQQELGLETAFEGNRFHDLMRIALRRIRNGEGTASYLADKVAAKHTDNKEAIRTKLMDTENWYIRK
ncbi:MAG: RagB/SusD family nutrient uptake outer membrane protein [Paludibacter sp.]